MNDQEYLFAAVVAEPDDDTVRMVYADWLEDNGDPHRADFIRLQIELERLPAGAARRRRRAGALLRDHAARWLGPAARLVEPARVEFRRGFPHAVELDVSAFDRLGPEVFAALPTLRGVRLFPAPTLGHHAAFLMSQVWAIIRDAAPSRPTPARPAAPARVEFLAVLPPQRGSTLESILSLPGLENLTGLDLSGHGTNAPAFAVAGATHLTRLRELDLSGNAINVPGARALARAPHLRGLRALHLRGCHPDVLRVRGLRSRLGLEWDGGRASLRRPGGRD